MKLQCFGDCNTYGYDPCGFFGGRCGVCNGLRASGDGLS